MPWVQKKCVISRLAVRSLEVQEIYVSWHFLRATNYAQFCSVGRMQVLFGQRIGLAYWVYILVSLVYVDCMHFSVQGPRGQFLDHQKSTWHHSDFLRAQLHSWRRPFTCTFLGLYSAPNTPWWKWKQALIVCIMLFICLVAVSEFHHEQVDLPPSESCSHY